MTVPFFQIDSFTERPFAGNPAGVCLLEELGEPSWMQAVAAERNVPATAFLAPRAARDEGWDLRWFTPGAELPLCGHGTLAAAHALWENGAGNPQEALRLHSPSGELSAVQRTFSGVEGAGWIELDLPVRRSTPLAEVPPGLAEALGATPAACALAEGNMLLAELASDEAVRALTPDHERLRGLPFYGVIVTARSAAPDFDMVSRYFAPGAGIAEDPVTGSAHCALAPYWQGKLGRDELVGFQASARGGVVRVRWSGDRVKLAGRAVTVLRGALSIAAS
jgi:PhzF family phenazine biosynthesis protein